MEKRRQLLWSIVAIAIAAVTIWAVFSKSRTMTFAELSEILSDADPKWLAAAVASMFGFIFFEGEALLVLCRGLGYGRGHSRGLVYSAGDVYFSAITPSASGGQPASAYFMIKDGIPAAVTTAVLLMNLVMYTLVILVLSVTAAFISPVIFANFNAGSRLLIIAGFVVSIVLGAAYLMLLSNGEVLFGLLSRCMGGLGRLHLIRNVEKRRAKLHASVEDFRYAAELMRGQAKVLAGAFLFNLLQRISQLMVPVFTHLAMHGAAEDALKVWSAQCFVTIGSYAVPIPGAMGVIDYMMIDGFGEIMPESRVYRLELISRSLSFYSCIVLSAAIVLIGYIAVKRREKSK